VLGSRRRERMATWQRGGAQAHSGGHGWLRGRDMCGGVAAQCRWSECTGCAMVGPRWLEESKAAMVRAAAVARRMEEEQGT